MDRPIKGKLVMLGASGVGKTALVSRYLDGEFRHTEGTIGASFATKMIKTESGTKMRIEIWDTAGQERFHALAPLYYRSADAAIVVFDSTSGPSLTRAQEWIDELRRHESNVLIALVANKSDMQSSPRILNGAHKFAIENDIFFFETSAFSGQNVDELFNEMFGRLSDQLRTGDQLAGNLHALKLNGELGLFKGKKRNMCCAHGNPKSSQFI